MSGVPFQALCLAFVSVMLSVQSLALLLVSRNLLRLWESIMASRAPSRMPAGEDR